MQPLMKIGLASTGALIVASGLVAGVALAQTPSGPASGNPWLARFAQALGKSEDEVKRAAQTASIAQVDEAVQAGRLTPEQAQRIKERIAQMPFAGPGMPFPKPGGPLAPMGKPGGPRAPHDKHPGPMGLRGPLAGVAQFLGMPPADLAQQL